MTVPSERFLAFVGASSQCLNGASSEDEPLRPDAVSGPGYAKRPGKGDPAVKNGLRHVPNVRAP